MGSQCDATGLDDDWVNSKGEQNRPQLVPLLHSPGASDGLASDALSASEKRAVMTVAAINSRDRRRKVRANNP